MSSTLSVPDQDSQSSSPEPMPQSLRPFAVPLAVLLLGPLVFLALRLFPRLDLRYQTALGHFIVVSGASLLCVGLALLILRVALLRRDGRVLLIGGAFLGLSAVFLIHAISTPGVLFLNTGQATRWSTPLALAVCAILLAASTLDLVARQRWLLRRWRAIALASLLLWLLYVGMMLFYVPASALPGAGNGAGPTYEQDAYGAYAGHEAYEGDGAQSYGGEPGSDSYSSPAANAPSPLQVRLDALAPSLFLYLMVISTSLFFYSALSYGRRWRHTPTRPLAALTCGALLLAETSVTSYYSNDWHLTFWLYHVLLVGAIVTVTYGMVIGYEQSGSLSSAVEGLLLGSTLQRQRIAFQSGMASLLGALEQGAVGDIPALRQELRQRFSLAEDQLDLLDHAVELVAREREEQRRLRALAEVSRAATLDLDPDLLLRNAVATLSKLTDASLCAIGLLEEDRVVFAAQHCLRGGVEAQETLCFPLRALPELWGQGAGEPVCAPLGPDLAAIGCTGGPALLAPLYHHDRALGVLVVQHGGSGSVDERMSVVYSSIAAHLAAALSNARLYQELQHKHENVLQAEHAKEQLTQMVVHDLKSPLTAIIGYLDLLHATGLKSDQQEIVEGGLRSSASMLQLVDDILDIARLEDGRLELRREASNIAELLHSCAAELGHWAREERKEVVLDLADSLSPLQIDGGLMRRVLLNFFSNAIKHTPEGVQITLGAGIDADVANIWVCDNGPGIAPERQSALFDRFSGTESSSGRQSSSGLGLTFCKLVVEAHGGWITVDSRPGQGATFTVCLPLHTVDETAVT